MKINKSYKALLIMVFLAFGSFVFFNPLVSTQAGTINEIQAGDTIWYTVEQFTDLGVLIPGDENGSIAGTFVGSQIYAKVLKVGEDTVTYYDGTTFLTEAVPTVDISTGAILGSPITLSVPDDTGTLQDVILPAGAGFPVPLQFATISVLNVTNFPSSVLPLPLILNDDWAMHEAIMNELATTISSAPGGSASVFSDAAEFTIEGTFVNSTSSESIDIAATWSKADGLLQSVEAHIDVADGKIDMKLALEKKEFKPLVLQVDDTWSLSIDDIGFDLSMANLDPGIQANISAGAQLVQAQIDTLLNQVLIEMTVKEIDGLYYRVTGFTWDSDTGAMIPIESNTWLTGFGTLNYQLPRLAVGGNNTDFFRTQENLKRIFSGPGFAITEDWEIYESFDLSLSAVVEGYESLLIDQLVLQSNVSDVDATVSMLYEGRQKNGGYEVISSTSVDASGPLELEDAPPTTISISASTENQMIYDHNGALTLLDFSTSASVSLASGELITLDNAHITLGVEYDFADGDSAPGDDEGVIPGLDVPGFDMYIAIMSIFSLGVIIRKRKY
ncbi:MAG: hypothetical protein HeimC2_13930 [Candidatus Heimdallarchaeota archaeon LC_2]|nr:MAG: hypothetical protein HeimC2_13930 [Candidatus Heimdallarchaeota archaeon LC_2]